MRRRIPILAAIALLPAMGSRSIDVGVPSLPELSAPDATALSASTDGTERREEAWIRLLEHVRRWPTDPAALRAAVEASPVVRRPDWPSWLVDPDAHRGRLVRIAGRLEQSTPVPWPSGERAGGAGLAEWFIRPDLDEDATAGAIQVWVVNPPPLAPDRAPRRVEVVGRFLRATKLEGRDGVVRGFPTVVGVAMSAPKASGWGPGPLIAILVVAMIPIVIWLRRRSKRPAGRLRFRAGDGEVAPREDRADLPSDPAEAMAVLEREAREEGRR